jgi:hypothetical protein
MQQQQPSQEVSKTELEVIEEMFAAIEKKE